MNTRWLGLSVVISLFPLAAACGKPQPSAGLPLAAGPTETMASPPTQTASPPTSTPLHAAIPTPGAQWNYSVLGDSSAWSFPKFYARYLEEDLGVTVDVKMWAQGGATSADVLEMLRTNAEERRDVSQSQVVTFYGNPLHLIGMRITSGYAKDRYDCSPQAVARYKAEMGSLADEILSLRKGQPTIIRTYARFMPFYRIWRATGNFDEFSRCAASLDRAVFEMAAERGILVADTGIAMNGPNHDQDPFDKGYLVDGIHENDEGGTIVAGAFRELGYDPIVP